MSDQDFFFDDDEQTSAKDAKAAAPKKGSTAARPAASAAPVAQTVSMTVAALIGVIALLAGLIVGILLPIGGSTAVPGVTGTVTTPPTQAAPQLSDEQVQSGDLPEGHPDISGMGGSAEATESGEASE